MKTLLLALMLSLFATPLAAQTTPSSGASTDPTKLSETELALVRTAVSDVRASYSRSRTGAGLGNIAGGLLIGGLGMYLYLSQDDPAARLVGVAISFSSVAPLVSGVWNLFYHTPQEDIADKLLADKRLLEGGGLLFVEQEARRGKRQRLVGGSTSIVAGAATLGSYFLLREFFLGGPDTILLVFFSAGAAIQVIQGVISLVGKSGPERAYANLISNMGRDPLAPKPSGTSISQIRVVPTVLANDGRLAPALGMSFRF